MRINKDVLEKIKVFLLGVITTIALVSVMGMGTSPQGPPVGRYQIVPPQGMLGSVSCWLLDTATGRVMQVRPKADNEWVVPR
jgi:hypothetical protein